MGWCSEFGPHIQAGCDHAMVAGSNSCSCSVCHAVCTGRFDGCASVWAAGPREVHLLIDGPQRSLAPLATLTPAKLGAKVRKRRLPTSNGNGKADDNGDAPQLDQGQSDEARPNGRARYEPDEARPNGRARYEPEPPPQPNGGGVALQILLTELRMLHNRIEQVHRLCVGLANDDQAERAVRMSEAVLTEFDALPDRIAGALAAALQEQHRRIMAEVRTVVDETVAGLRPAP